MNRYLLLVFTLLTALQSNSQVYERPCHALNSHENLDLDRIEVVDDKCMVHLTLRNRSLGGTFCIDSTTYLKNSLGDEQYPLLDLSNVAACPQSHRFASIGETLDFVISFVAPDEEVMYLDLVEPCEFECLSIKYILLDQQMNRQINTGFELYEQGEYREALKHFEQIMLNNFDNHAPVFGTLFLYLMSINYGLGEYKEVRRLYRELKSSSVVNREDIIEEARFEGLIR